MLGGAFAPVALAFAVIDDLEGSASQLGLVLAATWVPQIVFILLGPLFGAATFQLPEWTQNLSPFTHTPKLPGADVSAVPVAALIAITAALVATGLATFRHRNLTLPA